MWLTAHTLYPSALCMPVVKVHAGLFSSIFREREFNKVCENSRYFELFEQFDMQFRKLRILLFLAVQNIVLDVK